MGTLAGPIVDLASNTVTTQLGTINNWAQTALSSANSAISALGSFQPSSPGSAPSSPTPATVGGVKMPVIQGAGNPFSLRVDAFNKPAFNPGTTRDYVPGSAPNFDRSLVSFNLPAAPAPIDTSGAPQHPTLNDVHLPAPIDYIEPSMEELTPIVIPAFTFPVLPVFNAASPTFAGTAPVTVMQWVEPTYASENLDSVKAKVKTLLAGGTGIPPVVEQALFDRARGREDQITSKAVQEAFDTFAGKGFDMPPGMLAAQVNAALQDNQLKASTLSRDILTKAAEWEIENLKFAVQQGIALEGLLLNLFDNVAKRAFEVAKLKVESDITLYNAQVSLFNAMQQAYQTEANVFKIELEGELAKLDIFKAEIEAQRAIGEVNHQKVQVYVARQQAIQSRVETFKAMMQGAQIESEVNKMLVETFKTDIEAYATRLGAEKTRFDAYESQIKGEASKSSILQAEASAFAAKVQGYTAAEGVKEKSTELSIAQMKANVDKFVAECEAEKARAQSQAAAIQAQAQGFTAQHQAYAAQAQVAMETEKANISVAELNSQNHMHKYAADAKNYEVQASNMLAQAKIMAETLAAAAQAASHLATGAMSAIHVGAQIGGTGSLTEGFSETWSRSGRL